MVGAAPDLRQVGLLCKGAHPGEQQETPVGDENRRFPLKNASQYKNKEVVQ